MAVLNGTLMSKDTVICTVKNGIIAECNTQLLPLYLKRTGDMERWLSERAIDLHRVNSRLLKKALRLTSADDLQTVLSVNAATITDTYWFKEADSALTYDTIRFKENMFDTLALRGDPNGFSQKPSRTPELTNIGSFEKCWRLIDGSWWMYKQGTDAEYFSELFIYTLGNKLGFDMAYYEMDGGYIRTKDFTNGAVVNFESIDGMVGDDDNYEPCFRGIYEQSEELAIQYLEMIYMDTLCLNLDRHTKNFGVLRDVESGKILKMAPNYDNNVALISRGTVNDISRKTDGLIEFFEEFVKGNEAAGKLYSEMDIPVVTVDIIDECLKEIPIQTDNEYIRAFILNGQKRMAEILGVDLNQEQAGTEMTM